MILYEGPICFGAEDQLIIVAKHQSLWCTAYSCASLPVNDPSRIAAFGQILTQRAGAFPAGVSHEFIELLQFINAAFGGNPLNARRTVEKEPIRAMQTALFILKGKKEGPLVIRNHTRRVAEDDSAVEVFAFYLL